MKQIIGGLTSLVLALGTVLVATSAAAAGDCSQYKDKITKELCKRGELPPPPPPSYVVVGTSLSSPGETRTIRLECYAGDVARSASYAATWPVVYDGMSATSGPVPVDGAGATMTYIGASGGQGNVALTLACEDAAAGGPVTYSVSSPWVYVDQSTSPLVELACQPGDVIAQNGVAWSVERDPIDSQAVAAVLVQGLERVIFAVSYWLPAQVRITITCLDTTP